MTKKRVVSFIVAVVMLFSFTASPVLAIDDGFQIKSVLEDVLTKGIALIMNALVGSVNLTVRDRSTFQKEADFTLNDFYEGNKKLLDEPQAGSGWLLGYGSESLVPENMDDYKLFLGGFITINNGLSNKVKGAYDDMRVRTIALSDGSENGTAVFATIDCIGMTNTDIRKIRADLSAFASENNINSINIFATHCHSCIDTQGLWTETLKTIPKNLFFGAFNPEKVEDGTDENYMAFLKERVKKSIVDATQSMEKGVLTFAQKDLGSSYFSNKNRSSATAEMTDLTRFLFTPDNGGRPTIIANLAAHPDIVGLATDEDDSNGQMLSGDYIYYIGEVLNSQGYNFMFFNGAICGIYIGRGPSNDNVQMSRRVEISQRYGREIGRILLAMTMTENEIKADPYLSVTGDSEEDMAREGYTLWYKNWVPVSESVVKPLLNVRLKSVKLDVTNPVVLLAGKTGMMGHTVLKDKRNYKLVTEIGVVQIGNHKAVLMPGEISQDLICGGASLTKEGSINKEDFSGKTIREIFGEDAIIFGLANDAIGYVVPDNDYCMGLVFDHYQETLSVGKNTASSLMSEYESLAEDCGF